MIADASGYAIAFRIAPGQATVLRKEQEVVERTATNEVEPAGTHQSSVERVTTGDDGLRQAQQNQPVDPNPPRACADGAASSSTHSARVYARMMP